MKDIDMINIERPWMKSFLMADGNEAMASRGFKLIGLKLYSPNDENAIYHAKMMQKSLYGREDWLYINDGFSISGDVENGFNVTIREDAFDSEFLLYTTEHGVKVSISAIVGQNGTGKSTIIDMILRTLNNLSAAIMGETFNYSSAQHLHYIDHVYASVAVYLDHEVKVLTVNGRNVSISTVDEDNHCDTIKIFEEQSEGDVDEPLKYQKGKHAYLSEWFYTIVSNYSLYAYNYRDYESERTSVAKLERLYGDIEHLKNEDYFWLKGVFHKNDGYQTPVVVHPMREEGYINASKENMLGKNNLVNLAFYEVKKKDEEGKTIREFPLRIINNTYEVVGFTFKYKEENEYEGFEELYLGKLLSANKNKDEKEYLKQRFVSMVNPICKFWAKQMRLILKEDIETLPNLKRQAWEYVAYKTLKIIQTYKPYEKDWNWLSGDRYKESFIENYIHDVLHDQTHRTKKLRQQLAFLAFLDTDDYYAIKEDVVFTDNVDLFIKTYQGEFFYKSEKKSNRPTIDFKFQKEDLLPPPIADVTLMIVKREDKMAFKNNPKSVELIPFTGLSSGERQIAYTLGNVLYHLVNINSTVQDDSLERSHLSFLKYNHVCMLMDEVELYYHPDLQRKFVYITITA
jgi:ABC-type dipeptide/oligopeptide/nickel transport system ATPase component